MKKFSVLLFFMLLTSTLPAIIVKETPTDKEKKVMEDFRKNKITYGELQKKYREFLQAHQNFLKTKHKALLSAQMARNSYLLKAGEKDALLKKDLPLFSRGILRNTRDKAVFIRVYAKLEKDPEFIKLDKALWKAKLNSLIASFERQMNVPGVDPEIASFEKTSREYQELLRKGAIANLGNGKTTLSAKKGSLLYRAALGEIESFGKKSSPREVFLARQRLSFYMRELFRSFQEAHPTLDKAFKEQEKALVEKNITLFKLQKANEEAAYAQYLQTFGVKSNVKGATMNEIIAKNTQLQALEKTLAAKRDAFQKETNKLLKESRDESAAELKNISARMQLLFGKNK